MKLSKVPSAFKIYSFKRLPLFHMFKLNQFIQFIFLTISDRYCLLTFPAVLLPGEKSGWQDASEGLCFPLLVNLRTVGCNDATDTVKVFVVQYPEVEEVFWSFTEGKVVFNTIKIHDHIVTLIIVNALTCKQYYVVVGRDGAYFNCFIHCCVV